MRIRAFNIDGFGVLSNVTVEDLPRGMGIFLGNNEAGKSTCLDFFRTMLTGYPSARTREGRRSRELAGQGGALQLETEDGALLRLSRRPGPGGGTSALYDADGNPLDMTDLDRLLSGITREVYRNIYGFSLTELQTFDSLSTDAVRNALYGASFGLGLNSPGATLDRMNSAMEALFKPGGKNPALNTALRGWDENQRALREAEENAGRYDTMAGDLAKTVKNLAALRTEKTSLEGERRTLERRLGVWNQWEEWQLARVRMERLEPVADTFPLDGSARLEQLLDRREAARRQTFVVQARVARLTAALNQVEYDGRLPALATDIHTLNERKSSCRNALSALPALCANRQRAEEMLTRQLATLGPGWNVARIRAMDRSLFVREELERRAAAIQAADTGVMTLATSFERAARDSEQAKHAAELARQTLESMPEPMAELDGPARDNLRAQVLRVEEARQRLPEREKSLAASRSEYSRALSYLDLRPDAPGALLYALADAQGQSLLLADEVRGYTEKVATAKQEVQAARKEEEAATDRLARLQKQEAELGGPDRQELNSRRLSLRRLRQSAVLLQQEEERLTDFKERYAAQEASFPRPRKNKAALAAGVFLGFIGIAMLAVRLGLGWDGLDVSAFVSILPLPEALAAWSGFIPLPLLSGYLILFLGVVFIATGLPRPVPDLERSQVQLDQLRSRRDASNAKRDELQAEVRTLCDELHVGSTEALMLDALESQLDREREQCATSERLGQEKAVLQAELDAKRRQFQEKEAGLAAAESAVQTARRRWHDSFERLGVVTVPSPEAASAYFARVESTRLARISTASLEEELKELRGRGSELARIARELLPPETLPYSVTAGEIPVDLDPAVREAVMDAVRQVLDSCRQADAQAEERARAAEALRGAENTAVRSDEACVSQERALREAQAARVALDEEWSAYLADLGLDLHLSPATTREALDCMERCLGAESELARLREDIAMRESERDALAVPLARLLTDLGREAHSGLDREPDWLATLDILQRDVDNACRQEEEKQRIEVQLAERQAEQREAEVIEADACRAVDALLALGQTSEPETFRRLAAVREERDTLLRRCQDLEDALRLAATETPLDDFLAEFAGLEKNALDARSEGVERRLEILCEEERQQASEVAGFDARLKEMEGSRRLAELRVEEAALKETVNELTREWSRYALARQLLQEARRHYEKERQPEVVRLASEIFSTITGGAWPLIAASLEDSSLRVVPPHGDPIAPDLLSRGAQEQLYLALRMAHIRIHGRHTTPLPVIMDDILVNFDPGRAGRTMEALTDLTLANDDAPGHQILFFTCHPDTAERLRSMVPQSALYSVEDRRISKVG